MDRERWQVAERIFERALEQDAGSREDFLLEACDGNPGLCAEVEELLKHHESAKALGVSTATVHRDLRLAKAWMHREMGGAGPR